MYQQGQLDILMTFTDNADVEEELLVTSLIAHRLQISDEAVLSLDATGRLTAHKDGSVAITLPTGAPLVPIFRVTSVETVAAVALRAQAVVDLAASTTASEGSFPPTVSPPTPSHT